MALDFVATYKVLVLGDSNVGKTCIVHRYCDEKYYDTYISTIGKSTYHIVYIFIFCLASMLTLTIFISFNSNSITGIDFKQKLINLDGVPIKLQIWDTAGQERFRTLTTAYYRGAMGILLMYDVTNLESYNNLSYWLRNIQENASPDVVKVLAGNKCECSTTQRMVDKERGEKVCQSIN